MKQFIKPLFASAAFFASFFALLLLPVASVAQLSGLSAAPDPSEIVRQFLKVDAPKLTSMRTQVKSPDTDLPLAMWVSTQSRLAPEVVLQSRLGGLSWLDIFIKFKVPVEKVIVPVEQAKCPPYGKAWGWHKKHGQGKRAPGAVAELKFSDDELADFVRVRAIAGIYALPVADVAARRCAGRDVRFIINEEHEKKHGKKPKGHDGNKAPGHSKGKGKGKGKGR